MVIRTRPHSRGFTLIEAIMVIVITGVISAIIAVFIKSSVDSYLTSSRRAELTEAADVALRRMAREVRLAVPNSLRMASASCPAPDNALTCDYLEFVPTKDGGRYRNEGDGSTGGSYLCSGGTANTAFDVLGIKPPSLGIGDFVVVYNDASLYDSTSVPSCKVPSNVYCGGSRATVNGGGAGSLSVSAAFANSVVICPNANNRFQVVDGATRAVTYACPTDGAGTMTRYWNYGFNPAQAPPPGGSTAAVVQRATCAIRYTPNVLRRNGLLSITLTVSDAASGEQIVAFREIHVDNTP